MYYVYYIAMKNTSGGVRPFEIGAKSLEDAIAYLEKTTGLLFAYEIKQ